MVGCAPFYQKPNKDSAEFLNGFVWANCLQAIASVHSTAQKNKEKGNMHMILTMYTILRMPGNPKKVKAEDFSALSLKLYPYLFIISFAESVSFGT